MRILLIFFGRIKLSQCYGFDLLIDSLVNCVIIEMSLGLFVCLFVFFCCFVLFVHMRVMVCFAFLLINNV